MRSWLFIPGDSEKKLGKVDGTGADAVILDLEDAVLPEAKPRARTLVHDVLTARSRGQRAAPLWVRINPLASALALDDLVAVMPGRPDGIMVPKITSPWDLVALNHYLEVLEVAHGLTRGSVPLVPVLTETAESLFSMGELRSIGDRLRGVTWGAEDLAVDLGAMRNRDETGAWTFTYQLARSLTLAAAATCESQAIETVYTDFRNTEGLRDYCERARRDGFTGMLAIHPGQVEVINAAFTPTPDEVDWARRVVALFERSDGAGAVQMDGAMLDIPHLKQARRLLQLAGE